MLMSGVLSFSLYRSAAAHQPIGGVVALLGHDLPRQRRDRVERIVVELGAGEVRQPRVEQADEAPRDAALGLPALAEQDDVLARQDRVLELRQDGLVVAEDARQEGRPSRRWAGGWPASPPSRCAAPARRAQLAEGRLCGRSCRGHGFSLPPGPARPP